PATIDIYPLSLHDALPILKMRIRENLDAKVSHQDDDPLLLEVSMNPAKQDETFVISLHQTYQTYVNSGDLNITVEYLNNLIQTSDRKSTRLNSSHVKISYA